MCAAMLALSMEYPRAEPRSHEIACVSVNRVVVGTSPHPVHRYTAYIRNVDWCTKCMFHGEDRHLLLTNDMMRLGTHQMDWWHQNYIRFQFNSIQFFISDSFEVQGSIAYIAKQYSKWNNMSMLYAIYSLANHLQDHNNVHRVPCVSDSRC